MTFSHRMFSGRAGFLWTALAAVLLAVLYAVSPVPAHAAIAAGGGLPRAAWPTFGWAAAALCGLAMLAGARPLAAAWRDRASRSTGRAA